MKFARRLTLGSLLGLTALAAPARAQTGAELMLTPFPEQLRLDFESDAWITDTGHSKQSDDRLQVGVIEGGGRVRLNPGDLASPRFGFDFKYFDINSTVRGLPNQAYDQSVAFATPVTKFDDWIIAVSGGVGYAGVRPFGDGNAWYGRADIILAKKIDKDTNIVLGIDYDGNRTYKPDVPLPGIAYMKRIQDNLQLTVGLPVTSIEWQPFEHMRVELSYLLVDNFNARVGYEFATGWEVYGSVGQRSDAFFLDGQRGSHDRLLFQQRRAEVGVTYRTHDAAVGEKELEFIVAAGYAFNGEFSAGFDQSNSRLIADMSDVPYLRAELRWKF